MIQRIPRAKFRKTKSTSLPFKVEAEQETLTKFAGGSQKS